MCLFWDLARVALHHLAMFNMNIKPRDMNYTTEDNGNHTRSPSVLQYVTSAEQHQPLPTLVQGTWCPGPGLNTTTLFIVCLKRVNEVYVL